MALLDSNGAKLHGVKVERLNDAVELDVKATSFRGVDSYGNLLLGDKGLEFYNERNERDYIQIPWAEVDRVSAPVMLGGRLLPRFTVHTKRDGEFAFSTRDNKATLRAMRPHVGGERLVKAQTFLGTIGAGARALLAKLRPH